MLQAARVVQEPSSSTTVYDELPRAFPRRSADTATVAQLMRQQLDIANPGSDAEALRLLRQIFPGAPLAMRVAALADRRAE
ncbi:transferase [Ancylobacter mangrovi]|uniref:Transferase n=1 Tax=Ancylobacter mangrovi TaxID=2972472 RepID=A0A9X2PCS5_9HYPH|nr:transferase [Ancylobacter mangrovi]MCS0496347.1 transferase [Ancylobacter mangrovi]MCS0504359.1 transferase [Ancylobacter mangrovi]